MAAVSDRDEAALLRELDRRAKVKHGIEPELPIEWVRLKGGNDWGNIYFALKPLDGRGMASFDRGIKVEDGERVAVRWASGDIGGTVIEIVRQTHTVGDMGRSYEVDSYIPHVVSAAHGHKVLIPIDEVDVPLSWVNAHTRASAASSKPVQRP